MDLGFLPENMQYFSISGRAAWYGPKGDENAPLIGTGVVGDRPVHPFRAPACLDSGGRVSRRFGVTTKSVRLSKLSNGDQATASANCGARCRGPLGRFLPRLGRNLRSRPQPRRLTTAGTFKNDMEHAERAVGDRQ